MIIITGGKIYDTSKATKIAGPVGNVFHFQSLYQMEKSKTFFIINSPAFGENSVSTVTKEEAQEWCESNPVSIDVQKEYFDLEEVV